jgi:hypothetical protein
MKNMEYSQREINALLLYQGCGVPGEVDAFYRQESAYRTFNLLMMAGKEGEYVRICVENQRPTELYIRRWEKTLEVLTDLFTMQCKYTIEQRMKGNALPNPLERGDRGVNFQLMQEAGGTFAFTSTSKDAVLDQFLSGKENPHVLHITLGEGVPYLDFEGFLGNAYSFSDEREVLLPPMVSMTCSPVRIVSHADLGTVSHYDLKLEGFKTVQASDDEQKLAEFLNAHAEGAAQGLADLVQSKQKAAVFAREDHIYWQWKAAFQKLTLQRMCAIYETYFA